jgi:uncharacterized repeat protein (TIGR03837 family)
MRWDVFCRVVDNLGDVGVCWRLACNLACDLADNLAGRGDHVRLVIDDASALAWMAPGLHPCVDVQPWSARDGGEHADAVVEAFGCSPPDAYVQRMALMQAAAPVWINLEYLSAEPYVQRSHGLPSPQANGLTKWFFYPGFFAGTGGLLCEANLLQRQHSFDRSAWLAGLGITLQPGERVVSLFCYDNPALPTLLDQLTQPGQPPTLLLATPGHAQRQVAAWLQGSAPTLPNFRTHALPWLTQTDYDHLLWASCINCVRGEDSLVRAIWAGKPFVWQAYVQSDGAHFAKLRAMLQAQAITEATGVNQFWRAWNQLPEAAQQPLRLPETAPWQAGVAGWAQRLRQQADLATALRQFVRAKQAQPGS